MIHYLWVPRCWYQISENGNILPGNESDAAHSCCLSGQTGIAVLCCSCGRMCLTVYSTWVLLCMIPLLNEFGRVLQEAGWQEGFQREAAAFGIICSEILCLPCFCCCLVCCVFLFHSELTEGFAGRAPSAITFKAATWSTVAVRKALSGSDMVAYSQGFHPSPFFICAMKIWIQFVISPLLSTASVLHIHPEIMGLFPWSSRQSTWNFPSPLWHSLFSIFVPLFFFWKEKFTSLTQRKVKCSL